MKQQLLIASRNEGKTREIRAIIAGLNIDVVSLLDFPDLPETVEDGETLEANAIKKGMEAYRETGIPSLADDTGLEVVALNMAPGVLSARYAGENVTYAQNNAKLLAALADVPEEQRMARFRCVAALVGPKGSKTIEGVCHGRILHELRGVNGFGYDPLFVPDGYSQTFAELSVEVKNLISHRARAFRSMRDFLASAGSGLM